MNYIDFKKIFNYEIIEKSKSGFLQSLMYFENKNNIYNNKNSIELFLVNQLINIQDGNFENAYRLVFEKYFEELGYKNLEKNIESITNNKKNFLNLDQLFTDGKTIYFVEQKVRDDHDSTKKRGQIENFEKKLIELLKINNGKNIQSYTYFIDPSLVKNKNFYLEETSKIENDYNVSAKLCYGAEFWEDIGHFEVWDELLKYLEQWKKEIPDMPSINFDENAEDSFKEIKDLSVGVYRKLFENEKIIKEILPIIFPDGEVLKLLNNYFEELGNKAGKNGAIYLKLAEKIKNIK